MTAWEYHDQTLDKWHKRAKTLRDAACEGRLDKEDLREFKRDIELERKKVSQFGETPMVSLGMKLLKATIHCPHLSSPRTWHSCLYEVVMDLDPRR